MNLVKTRDGHNYLVPFALITSLFFLWGFAHSILDVLNKYFQDTMGLTKTQSALVQAVVYGGYFLMALPAGALIKRWGYRAGVLTGLLLYGIGALLFIPGGQMMNFGFFLFSLFIIGCGLTFLETSANPYVTVLGPSQGAEQRINFSQSFNGLGWILGPLVGGMFLFTQPGEQPNITLPYALIGIVVLAIALVFARVRLPEVAAAPEQTDDVMEGGVQAGGYIPLFRHKKFVFGLVSLFLYVAAQTGVNSFFINYTTDPAVGISTTTATLLLAFGCMGLFMVGRLCGSWLMSRIRAERILTFCALGATLATFVILLTGGMIGTVALFFVYLFESIMFPTIFALSIRGLGSKQTKQASSYLIMSIVGGAVAPTIMAFIGERSGLAQAFIVPLICYIAILLYGMKYKTLK